MIIGWKIKHLCTANLLDLKELDKLAGRDVIFSGIVTKAEHRTAKSGKQFGILAVEDHHGTHDFMLFSEDYLKFKLYLVPGTLLLMKGRASMRTWGRDEGQMEFKLTNIDLLSDARDKYITKINLKIEAERMTESIARELAELFKASPGKCTVNLQLLSKAGQHRHRSFRARVSNVTVTEELVRGLDGIAEVEWGMN